jgi:hypothetical protein
MSTKKPERIETGSLDAIERELTPEVARRLLEFGARRSSMLRAAGVAVSTDEARFLVQDAVADTLARAASWIPEAAPLWLHLRGIMRRRSWAKLVQAYKRPGLPVDQLESSIDPAADPASIGELRDRRRSAIDVLRQVRAHLDERNPEDVAVRSLVDAYCGGATSRAEVTETSGLSAEAYVHARRRLDQLLAALPEPVVTSAFQTMWEVR